MTGRIIRDYYQTSPAIAISFNLRIRGVYVRRGSTFPTEKIRYAVVASAWITK